MWGLLRNCENFVDTKPGVLAEEGVGRRLGLASKHGLQGARLLGRAEVVKVDKWRRGGGGGLLGGEADRPAGGLAAEEGEWLLLRPRGRDPSLCLAQVGLRREECVLEVCPRRLGRGRGRAGWLGEED